jgi:hypothetical protein
LKNLNFSELIEFFIKAPHFSRNVFKKPRFVCKIKKKHPLL